MPPHPDVIADCVLSAFHALPAKFKPRTLADGRREEDALTPSSTSSPPLTCAALATGMKCLPQNKLELAKGNVLHDWHAEVLAIRAFNRFLVDECADLAKKGFQVQQEGGWVRWRQHGQNAFDGGRESKDAENEECQQPLELREDVSIHMYCSEAPCGDASMELVMMEQDDATPWTTGSIPKATGESMLGRGHFDQLGIVRRKPARPDAPITFSKSCSDKLALKQCMSLLSGLTSMLLRPERVYLSTLVLPKDQHVPHAVERAFGRQGRMRAVAGVYESSMQESWRRAGYGFNPFEVKTTSREFEYSKRSARTTNATSPAPSATPSNLSALSTAKKQEILINGVLQGRKQFDPKGASWASRRSMWKAVLDVAGAVGVPVPQSEMAEGSYAEMKSSKLLESREAVKMDVWELALQGWKRNVSDEAWTLEVG
ncbi:hypothetical protein LTR37_000207 [Vermiconidia calcicola]|uniref:Uncharacterized protein n=1 Tax=Vermiconidia calcicola TaxID=1690605 RepID=A0ACC3NZP8_9PEZI|nr:hypothetical protein LTR37_000207 [Vermiconidia calcicola]